MQAPKAAVWTAITDIENAAHLISGVERIEIIERADSGLVGLRWRETRMLFGKPATVEKQLVEAAQGSHYTTRAKEQGFVYLTSLRLTETASGLLLTSTHDSLPQGLASRLMLIPMWLFFRGAIRKHILQDLQDIKRAVESP